MRQEGPRAFPARHHLQGGPEAEIGGPHQPLKEDRPEVCRFPWSTDLPTRNRAVKQPLKTSAEPGWLRLAQECS